MASVKVSFTIENTNYTTVHNQLNRMFGASFDSERADVTDWIKDNMSSLSVETLETSPNNT